MRLVLEKRAEHSVRMAILSPIIAFALTVIAGGLIFALRGLDPLEALYVYFVEPLTQDWAREQLIVKATPLVLIGVGLSVCYTANVWNIGAEGQFILGALFAGMIPVYFPAWQSPDVMVVMLALGMLAGMAWAAIPAVLKVRFNANEILSSLMLVYVAQFLFDWLVRGPWRDPHGFNFPKTVNFDGWQVLPRWGDIHLGALFAVVAALALAVISVESAGRSDAVSHAGAAGLMQLIPATAERFGVVDRMDPSDNIRGGVAYLDWLMGQFGGDPLMVLAAYNAGENAVRGAGGVPAYAETRNYVPKVLAAWMVARGLCVTPPDLVSDGCVFAANG